VFEPGHVTERRPPFRFAVYTRVAFSDTDAQGVVYYGRYLPYFDLARTEYLRNLGRFETTAGSEFVVRALNVEVFVRISRIGRTSVSYEFEAYRIDDTPDDKLMVTARQTSVLIDPEERRTLPVAVAFRDAVTAFEGIEL
jgi:acyl-CoA thioester hydrolase